MNIAFGPILLSVSAPAPLAQRAKRRYAPFSTQTPASIQLKLKAAKARPGAWEPTVTRTATGFKCRASQFEWILKKNGIGNGTLRPTEQNLDSLLRTVYCALLPERGGALLHAAAAVKGGVAHLFIGPSGAGKTTLARQLAGAAGVKILCDELPILTRGRSSFTVHSTPFWGEFRLPENNGRGRLGGLYFLAGAAQGTAELKPVAAADAQKRLLRCLVSFERSVETISAGWDLLLGALKCRPSHDLKWNLEASPEELARRLW